MGYWTTPKRRDTVTIAIIHWACTICQSRPVFIPSLGGMFIFPVRPPSLREGSYLSPSYICLVAKLCPTLLQPHGLYPARLLCPWDFPGKITREGCHFLHQGIFWTQGWNPCLPHWQVDSLPVSHQGSPMRHIVNVKGVCHHQL